MSQYVYDDQPCPKRTGGLTHARGDDGKCNHCSRQTYSAQARSFLTARDGDDVIDGRCQFATCKSTNTQLRHYTADIALASGSLWPAQDKTPIRTCPTCDRLFEDAERTTGVTIRLSPEDVAWIDNLDYLRFAT